MEYKKYKVRYDGRTSQVIEAIDECTQQNGNFQVVNVIKILKTESTITPDNIRKIIHRMYRKGMLDREMDGVYKWRKVLIEFV